MKDGLIGKRDAAHALEILTWRYPVVTVRRHYNNPYRYVFDVTDQGPHGTRHTIRTYEDLQVFINTGGVERREAEYRVEYDGGADCYRVVYHYGDGTTKCNPARYPSRGLAYEGLVILRDEGWGQDDSPPAAPYNQPDAGTYGVEYRASDGTWRVVYHYEDGTKRDIGFSYFSQQAAEDGARFAARDE